MILSTDVEGFQTDLCFESETFFSAQRRPRPDVRVLFFQARIVTHSSRDTAWTVQSYILFPQLGYCFICPLTRKSISPLAKKKKKRKGYGIRTVAELVYRFYRIAESQKHVLPRLRSSIPRSIALYRIAAGETLIISRKERNPVGSVANV